MAGATHSSRFLTEARIELVPAARLPLGGIVIAACLAVAVAFLLLQSGDGSPFARSGRLAAENASLRNELAQLRVEMDVERATRAALEQQLADLNAQVVEMTSQVEFYRAKLNPRAGRRD
jgi:septal ring factor EnvC (AmiA/AmiB activator)